MIKECTWGLGILCGRCWASTEPRDHHFMKSSHEHLFAQGGKVPNALMLKCGFGLFFENLFFVRVLRARWGGKPAPGTDHQEEQEFSSCCVMVSFRERWRYHKMIWFQSFPREIHKYLKYVVCVCFLDLVTSDRRVSFQFAISPVATWQNAGWATWWAPQKWRRLLVLPLLHVLSWVFNAEHPQSSALGLISSSDTLKKP